MPSHLPIVGPARETLEEMLEQIQAIEARDGIANKVDQAALALWWKQIDAWRAEQGIYTSNRFDDTTDAIKPQEVIQLLHELTQGKAFVTSDVGQHQMFAAQYYVFDEPHQWINSSYPENDCKDTNQSFHRLDGILDIFHSIFCL